jgi:hypothetical protein
VSRRRRFGGILQKDVRSRSRQIGDGKVCGFPGRTKPLIDPLNPSGNRITSQLLPEGAMSGKIFGEFLPAECRSDTPIVLVNPVTQASAIRPLDEALHPIPRKSNKT